MHPMVSVEFEICIICVTANASDSNYVTVVPPSTVFLNIFADLVANIDMSKDVTVIYDDLYGMQM